MEPRFPGIPQLERRELSMPIPCDPNATKESQSWREGIWYAADSDSEAKAKPPKEWWYRGTLTEADREAWRQDWGRWSQTWTPILRGRWKQLLVVAVALFLLVSVGSYFYVDHACDQFMERLHQGDKEKRQALLQWHLFQADEPWHRLSYREKYCYENDPRFMYFIQTTWPDAE